MTAFWRTEDGRLRIGVVVLLALLCIGPVDALSSQKWDAADLLLLPLFILGMTVIATARRRMPETSSTRARLRSPLYIAGVIALVTVWGVFGYNFLSGVIEGWNSYEHRQ